LLPEVENIAQVNLIEEGVEKPNSPMRQRFYDQSYIGHESQEILKRRSSQNSSFRNDPLIKDGVVLTSPESQVLELV